MSPFALEPQTYVVYPSICMGWKHPLSAISEERHVSFSDEVYVYEVMSRHDYMVRETESAWFNAKELKKIQREVDAVARRIQKRSLGPNECVRGIETRTSECRERRRIERLNILIAVFREQCQERKLQMHDPYRIREIYAYASSAYQYEKEALDKALLDEIEARSYQEESNWFRLDTKPGIKPIQGCMQMLLPFLTEKLLRPRSSLLATESAIMVSGVRIGRI